MKLLDVMKKYDRCVVRESAKLTKIYNLLLKESEEADNIEEAEVCPDCGEDPCVCESGKEVDTTEEVNEEDSNVMSAEEFFAEAEKAAAKKTSECSESEEATSEAEEMVSAEEFFKESETDDDEEEKKANDDIGEAEEMMSAEEFFAEAETDADEDEKKANDDIGEAEKDIDEEEEEKKLEESLKSYRRANHRLFNN